MMKVDFICRMLVDDVKVKIWKLVSDDDIYTMKLWELVEETTAKAIKENGYNAELRNWKFKDDAIHIYLN